MTTSYDIAIVGGCGRVGLPLGLAFASRGKRVLLYDRNAAAVASVSSGELPFDEAGAANVLDHVVGDTLHASTDPAGIATAECVVVVIGTPVDEHLNPDTQAVPRAVADLGDHLRDGQMLVLRSTLYPGVTALVERHVAGMQKQIDVAFCPERIAEGKAMEELFSLPQIVSGRSSAAVARATALFRTLTDDIVVLSPEEAELAKLFTNTWRYVRFAIANQLYMIANDFGIDYERVRHAMRHDYPRAADLPGAGFAAGPCLLKDTMQLAAFNNNNFLLGHASMMVNEGLPLYVVSKLEERFELESMTVGVLGMSFKGGSDDIRDSLSYKLRRILRFKARHVLCTDPYVTKESDPELIGLDDVLERADVLIIGAPHPEYRTMQTTKPVIDVWDVRGQGVLI